MAEPSEQRATINQLIARLNELAGKEVCKPIESGVLDWKSAEGESRANKLDSLLNSLFESEQAKNFTSPIKGSARETQKAKYPGQLYRDIARRAEAGANLSEDDKQQIRSTVVRILGHAGLMAPSQIPKLARHKKSPLKQAQQIADEVGNARVYKKHHDSPTAETPQRKSTEEESTSAPAEQEEIADQEEVPVTPAQGEKRDLTPNRQTAVKHIDQRPRAQGEKRDLPPDRETAVKPKIKKPNETVTHTPVPMQATDDAVPMEATTDAVPMEQSTEETKDTEMLVQEIYDPEGGEANREDGPSSGAEEKKLQEDVQGTSPVTSALGPEPAAAGGVTGNTFAYMDAPKASTPVRQAQQGLTPLPPETPPDSIGTSQTPMVTPSPQDPMQDSMAVYTGQPMSNVTEPITPTADVIDAISTIVFNNAGGQGINPNSSLVKVLGTPVAFSMFREWGVAATQESDDGIMDTPPGWNETLNRSRTSGTDLPKVAKKLFDTPDSERPGATLRQAVYEQLRAKQRESEEKMAQLELGGVEKGYAYGPKPPVDYDWHSARFSPTGLTPDSQKRDAEQAKYSLGSSPLSSSTQQTPRIADQDPAELAKQQAEAENKKKHDKLGRINRFFVLSDFKEMLAHLSEDLKLEALVLFYNDLVGRDFSRDAINFILTGQTDVEKIEVQTDQARQLTYESLIQFTNEFVSKYMQTHVNTGLADQLEAIRGQDIAHGSAAFDEPYPSRQQTAEQAAGVNASRGGGSFGTPSEVSNIPDPATSMSGGQSFPNVIRRVEKNPKYDPKKKQGDKGYEPPFIITMNTPDVGAGSKDNALEDDKQQSDQLIQAVTPPAFYSPVHAIPVDRYFGAENYRRLMLKPKQYVARHFNRRHVVDNSTYTMFMFNVYAMVAWGPYLYANMPDAMNRLLPMHSMEDPDGVQKEFMELNELLGSIKQYQSQAAARSQISTAGGGGSSANARGGFTRSMEQAMINFDRDRRARVAATGLPLNAVVIQTGGSTPSVDPSGGSGSGGDDPPQPPPIPGGDPSGGGGDDPPTLTSSLGKRSSDAMLPAPKVSLTNDPTTVTPTSVQQAGKLSLAPQQFTGKSITKGQTVLFEAQKKAPAVQFGQKTKIDSEPLLRDQVHYELTLHTVTEDEPPEKKQKMFYRMNGYM